MESNNQYTHEEAGQLESSMAVIEPKSPHTHEEAGRLEVSTSVMESKSEYNHEEAGQLEPSTPVMEPKRRHTHEEAGQPEVSTSESEWKPNKAQWLMISCFMIVSLVVALDATILVPVLPAIAESLHGTTNDTFWAGTSYLLTCAVFQPFIVSLSDIFGRKQALLGSVIFFTIGTLVCCLSQNFIQFLTGRTIQGIGGGGVTALPNVIFTDFIPLRQRPRYNSFNQIAWAVGTVTGPLIGGLFADHANWRWIFYINFPFCAIGIVMIPLVVKLHAERPKLLERLFNLDLLGIVLFFSTTCALLIGITSGGIEHSWKSWRTVLPLELGGIGIILTVLWERYTSKPFLRLSVFNSFSICAAYVSATLQGLLMFCQLYYIPFFLETVKNLSPTMAGVGLLPITCALLPVSIIVGSLITKFGRFRWAIWSGWVITVGATGLLILLDVNRPALIWIHMFILVGLGHGLILMSLNFCIQALVDGKDVGYAAAMYTFLRTFGMCIGVAIGGTVFQNRLSVHLEKANLPVEVARSATAFVSTLKQIPPSAQKTAFVLAYSLSFRDLFQVLTGIAGLGAILSLCIKKASMDKYLESDHVMRESNKSEV